MLLFYFKENCHLSSGSFPLGVQLNGIPVSCGTLSMKLQIEKCSCGISRNKIQQLYKHSEPHVKNTKVQTDLKKLRTSICICGYWNKCCFILNRLITPESNKIQCSNSLFCRNYSISQNSCISLQTCKIFTLFSTN